jgi:hypothetical protein
VAPNVTASVPLVGSAMQTVDALTVIATAAGHTTSIEAATKMAAAESTSSEGAAAIASKRAG